ncbi:MAG: hypothetical protein BWY91_02117 [bacterium ADurb.BinA028]|nr:MAG: hypothetical protein BWY91_02117 [bacterium ADurb.BinA028]
MAEEAYLKWAVAQANSGSVEPDLEVVQAAVDSVPAHSLLPWDRPDDEEDDDGPRPNLGPAEARVAVLDPETARPDQPADGAAR